MGEPMNMSATSAHNPMQPDPLSPESRSLDALQCRDVRPQPLARDAFERVLRSKERRHKDGDADAPSADAAASAMAAAMSAAVQPFTSEAADLSLVSGDTDTRTSDAAASAITAANTAPLQPFARQAVAVAASPAGAVETVTTGPRAVIEAALNSNPGPSITPIGDTDPAAIWEASVCEPNSIAVDVRAVRAERATAHEAQPSWSLTIGSSTVNAEALARHAPRLNERLRKHAIEFGHVRIERDEEDDL
jgi:hypothetical protein